VSVLLAAVDDSPAARGVLAAAAGLAPLMGAEVEAIHVDPGGETARLAAAAAGVPYRVVPGPVEEGILAALADSRAVGVVVGARGRRAGRRPVGTTARRLIERAAKPVAVVPPDYAGGGPPKRLLVPLDGTVATSEAVGAVIRRCSGVAELVVLHVFDAATTPRFLDRPAADIELLGREFLASHCPGLEARFEARVGAVGEVIVEEVDVEGAELVVLGWSQVFGDERAAVVREVLGRARVPVLLVPLGRGS
jgi:nucleotide-binding universal stress UspA family protein